MTISIEEAQPVVGTGFVVHTEQGPVELVLESATERPRRGLPERFRTPLSLIFRGPSALPLAQGLFTFDHSSLGRQQWVLTPVMSDGPPPKGAAADVRHYEVFFS